MLLKIVMLGVAAYGVWATARRWMNVLGMGPAAKPVQPPAPPTAPPSTGPVQSPRRVVIEDTHQCPGCGAYIPVSAAKCGQPSCPQT